MANIFNRHYATIRKVSAEKIQKTDQSVGEKSIKPSTMLLMPIYETEVVSIIDELKINKCPGLVEIKTDNVKIMKQFYKKPLTIMINKIFENGVFPN